MEKKNLYLVTTLAVLLLSVIFVKGFGTTDPAVFGHSPAELLVNGTSVIDGTLLGADLATNTVTGTQID